MTYHCLITIEPLDPVTGARRAVHVASASLRSITGLFGIEWSPCMVGAPVTSMKLFDGNFSAAIEPGRAGVALSLKRLRDQVKAVDRFYWPGARLTMLIGKAGGVTPWKEHFRGLVSSFGRDGETLSLTAEVDVEPFAKDVLNRAYAGTGGAEGGADLKDTVRPLIVGLAQNVEPVLIDAENSVYQFSGYGAIEAVTTLYERASPFPEKTGDFATYAALVGASIAPGRWASCLAEGLIRLGAPAYGVITGDVRGHVVDGAAPRLTGAIIRMLASIAGVDESLIDVAALNAMDDATPYPINLVLTDQASFVDLAKRLALPCNHQCGIGLTGQIFVTGVGVIGPRELTLHTQGRALPQVVKADEMAVSPPYSRTEMAAGRCWRVHSLDEIAFYAPLTDRGAYSGATTYREGDIVSLPDGSRWLYTATTPSAGNEPPNGTYWGAMSGTIDGTQTNIVYRKAATQPATPSASADVPAGWVDDYASLPGSSDPVWASFGTKASGADTYVWDTPYPMLSDTRTYEAVKPDGTVADGAVSTPAIVDNNVNATSYSESAALIVFSSGTKTAIISFSFTKATNGSVLKLNAQLGFVSADAIDGTIFLELLSGASIVRTRSMTMQIDCNGNTQLPIAFGAFFTGLSAGTYTARVSFQRTTSNACSTNGTSHLEVTEQKK